MRVFYIMIVVAVIAIAVVVIVVVSSGFRGDEGAASRSTTSAVEGTTPDCAKLSGADKERCLQARQGSGTPAGSGASSR